VSIGLHQIVEVSSSLEAFHFCRFRLVGLTYIMLKLWSHYVGSSSLENQIIVTEMHILERFSWR